MVGGQPSKIQGNPAQESGPGSRRRRLQPMLGKGLEDKVVDLVVRPWMVCHGRGWDGFRWKEGPVPFPFCSLGNPFSDLVDLIGGNREL